MLPQWDESYSVDNKMIDAQHKQLFELAKKAYLMVNRPVTKEEIKDVLREFFEYMRDHFSDEEKYMYSIGYPKIEEHKKLHRQIIFELSEAIKTIRSPNDLKEKIGIIAKEWLLQHILKEDMQIHRYCKERAYNDDEIIDNDVLTYDYVCACPEKIHKIPHHIHERIETEGIRFVCKICKQVVKYKD